MSIDKQTARKIATLARIRMDDSEAEHYANEISSILKWVEQLQEVNTDNVPQMTSVAEMELPLRRDAVADGDYQEAVLKNAAASEYGCFVVPKVVE